MAAKTDDAVPARPARTKKPRDKAREPGWWDTIRTDYCEFDRRTLGFTRLLLGFYLILDLFRRSHAWWQMFSDEGVLPNHLNLYRPQAYGAFSIVNAFSTRGECWVLFGLILATYVCLFAGYKTKLMQVLALVWVTGMNGRVLLIENGGYVVQNLLLMWTCFLPLGDRFSLDTLLRSMKRTRERGAADLNDRSDRIEERLRLPHVTILGIALCIQTAAIYYFNVIHKTGPAWKNGTAVHYVLYVDRMATPLIAHLRDYVPNVAILFMTKSALAFEASLPMCTLSPLGRVWAKRLVIFMMNCLHIAFGTTFVLGPFAWALCVWSTLFFSREDWELANRTMRRTHRARTVVFDPSSGAQLFACRLFRRFDTMELLTFREEAGAKLHLEKPRKDDGGPGGASPSGGGSGSNPPGGASPRGSTTLRGADAIHDLVAVVPPFPAIAWAIRLPVLRQAFDGVWSALERADLSRFFALPAKPPAPENVEPSPIGRKLRFVVAGLREIGVVIMFIGAVNQALVELWCVNRRIRVPQPEYTRILAHKMRFLQGWFMFSPNPVMDDGTIVVDCVTVDGRHIDPFWNTPPNFDLIHAKSFGYNQIWSDYFNRMHLPGNAGYRDAMKEYIFRFPERTGNPNDAIVSGEVYWVQDMNPRWNETQSWKEERIKLFSFENPKYAGRTLPASAK